MSRIGKMPIEVPAGVDVKLNGSHITVKGSKGTLEQELHPDMNIDMKEGVINVTRPSEKKLHKSLHGLTRSLINNMIVGVTQGYAKELEINGVGYRAIKQGKDLVMNLGYSHQVVVKAIDGITIDVPSPNKIVVTGFDKQKVGQFAAEIREKRLPEPYKGKGIRYVGEYLKRKEGKAGKKQ
ncbi:MAG: 50S ribosomal protein L6 [Oscillospiraceae bacterium]|nr:50S ribosomal protein L6 [Oscillospiraceae bacterium]